MLGPGVCIHALIRWDLTATGELTGRTDFLTCLGKVHFHAKLKDLRVSSVQMLGEGGRYPETSHVTVSV